MAYGGIENPPRNRKGKDGNPPPTGARASALPDKGVTNRFHREPCAGRREASCEVSVAVRVGRANERRNA